MNPLHSSSLPRAYTLDFRREALRQLGSGQSLDKVARLMGVSKPSLLRWKKQAKLGPASQATNATPNPRHRAYPQATRQQALDWLAQGQSVSQVANQLGVGRLTVNRWKRQADASPHSSTACFYATSPEQNPADADSDSPSSAASLANIRLSEASMSLVNPTPDADPLAQLTPKIDRRCKYDYQFKQQALDKLCQGQRVSQVAKHMGVSVVTLYSWRKKAQAVDQLPRSGEAETLRLAWLGQQLQTVSHERDILKQALAILLRMEKA